MPDIFLSHSSRDMEQVRLIKEELVAQGFSVTLDIDVLPAIRPADVTSETAESLRGAMRDCTALLYVITANSRRSRWMPWELGYFDGFRGRVFIYPVDDAAERNAQGIEYLYRLRAHGSRLFRALRDRVQHAGIVTRVALQVRQFDSERGCVSDPFRRVVGIQAMEYHSGWATAGQSSDRIAGWLERLLPPPRCVYTAHDRSPRRT